jgi:hypothetical protein
VLHIDFEDLYARHLCRHSQLGVNLSHLVALVGTWFGIYAIPYHLAGQQIWIPSALAIGYLLLIAISAPMRICMATAGFLVLFVAAVLWLPELPIAVYALMVPICYKLQSWSHLLFTASADMAEFKKRYPKGPALFLILLVYEVPLVLNYLLFDRKRWTT